METAREVRGSDTYERIRAEVRTRSEEEGPKTCREMAAAVEAGRNSVYAAPRPFRQARRLVAVGTRATEGGGTTKTYDFRELFAGGDGAFGVDEQEAILHAVRETYGEEAAGTLRGRLDLHARILLAIERSLGREHADELLDAIEDGQARVRRHRAAPPDGFLFVGHRRPNAGRVRRVVRGGDEGGRRSVAGRGPTRGGSDVPSLRFSQITLAEPCETETTFPRSLWGTAAYELDGDVELQRDRFRAFAEEKGAGPAVELLEEAADLARVTAGDRVALTDLHWEDVVPLLCAPVEEVRRRALFAISRLDLEGDRPARVPDHEPPVISCR